VFILTKKCTSTELLLPLAGDFTRANVQRNLHLQSPNTSDSDTVDADLDPNDILTCNEHSIESYSNNDEAISNSTAQSSDDEEDLPASQIGNLKSAQQSTLEGQCPLDALCDNFPTQS
jgi:hypothetical protein